MRLLVRAAAPGDFEAATALLAELGRPAPTVDNHQALRENYAGYLDRHDVAPQVAESRGTIVGFMTLEFRQRLNWTTAEAWIPDLIVTADSRGTGAGKALLNRAYAIARERGCHRLSLESGYSRTVAHAFYTAQGMTNAGYFFTLNL